MPSPRKGRKRIFLVNVCTACDVLYACICIQCWFFKLMVLEVAEDSGGFRDFNLSGFPGSRGLGEGLQSFRPQVLIPREKLYI